MNLDSHFYALSLSAIIVRGYSAYCLFSVVDFSFSFCVRISNITGYCEYERL